MGERLGRIEEVVSSSLICSIGMPRVYDLRHDSYSEPGASETQLRSQPQAEVTGFHWDSSHLIGVLGCGPFHP